MKPNFVGKRLQMAILLLLTAALPCFADGEIPFGEATALLGSDLSTIVGRYGVPSSVSSVRGELPWQDDVVFRYDSGLSFFWFKNRVWQIRIERSFSGRTMGLSMGSTREQVEKLLGKPFYSEGEWTLYHYAGDGFPVRVRMFFDDKGLEDVYIYRGDF